MLAILVLAQAAPLAVDWKLAIEVGSLLFAAGGLYRLIQSTAKRQDEMSRTLVTVHDEARTGSSVAQEALRQAVRSHERIDTLEEKTHDLDKEQARITERLANANAWLRNTARLRPVEDDKA